MFHVVMLHRMFRASSLFFMWVSDYNVPVTILICFLSKLEWRIPNYFHGRLVKVVENVFPISLHGHIWKILALIPQGALCKLNLLFWIPLQIRASWLLGYRPNQEWCCSHSSPFQNKPNPVQTSSFLVLCYQASVLTRFT